MAIIFTNEKSGNKRQWDQKKASMLHKLHILTVLKEMCQACLKYGKVKQHFIPLPRESGYIYNLRYSLLRELNDA